METYQIEDSLSPARWLSDCHPLLNNRTDIYFIRTSTVQEKLYDSSKNKKQKTSSIPEDSLILQTFCSFSQVACFFLPRISSELINFGEWLWKSGITVANFIPLKFRHSWYIWGRLYFWDCFSQISSYSFSCSPLNQQHMPPQEKEDISQTTEKKSLAFHSKGETKAGEKIWRNTWPVGECPPCLQERKRPSGRDERKARKWGVAEPLKTVHVP